MHGDQVVQVWLSACNTGIVSWNRHKAYYICMVYRHQILTYVLYLYIMQWLQANKKTSKTSVNLSHCQRHCVHISLFYSEGTRLFFTFF